MILFLVELLLSSPTEKHNLVSPCDKPVLLCSPSCFLSPIFNMKRPFNLNVPSIENYPITKFLTRSDLTTSQLVLPHRPVEEHVVPYMGEELRRRLFSEDRRANIWLVDDEFGNEYFLTLVNREHRYSIISWSLVLHNRNLIEGQKLRLGWINQKLHFLVEEEEEDDKENDGDKDEKEKQESTDDAAESARKKVKQHIGASGSGQMTGVIF